MADLTPGAIQRASNNDTSGSPNLQVLDVKRIGQPGASERWRLVVSDGQHVMQAMLATQLNELVNNGQLEVHAVVQLQEFLCNLVQNRKVIILLRVQVLGNPGYQIGQPVQVDGQPVQQPGGNAPPPPAPAQQDPYSHQQQPPPMQQQQPPPPMQQQQQWQQQGYPQQPPNMQQQYQPPPPQQQYAPAPPQQYQQYAPQQYQQQQAGQQYQQQAPPPQQQPYSVQPYQQQYQQQPPQQQQFVGNGAVQQASGAVIMPINALNPYQNKWTIRARIMEKDSRAYSNARGDGKLMNLLVADTTGEIRLTGFNEVVDTYFDRVAQGRVYDISGGVLKPKNAQYNQTSHQFEITLNRGCSMEEVAEPSGGEAIPRYNFRFAPLEQLEQMPDDAKSDVLGVVADCTDPQTFTAKSGKEMTKRVMTLADQSGRSIECTIFGQPTQTIAAGNVVACKAAKVGSWNTKSLTLWADSGVTLHPDMPEAHNLLGWWQTAGQTAQLHPISVAGGGGSGAKASRKIVFSDIEDYALGMNSEPDYFSVRCTLTHIKTDGRTLWYIACPNCKKKLQGADEQELQGHCDKCDKTVAGQRRWIFTATCNDSTGCKYISFFDDQAINILGGKTADELAPLKLNDNESAFNNVFLSHTFKMYNLKCRVKSEMYMDEAKLKVSAIGISAVDWVSEGRSLLQEIGQLKGGF